MNRLQKRSRAEAKPTSGKASSARRAARLRAARTLEVKQPRQRNAIRTQNEILAAAQIEFARKGYDGARIDAIVARARVSKNLVYHYFGSKEDLYIRVLERTYETLRQRQDAIPVDGLDPVSALTALCEATFQVFIDEPGIIVMLNTENLYRGRHISKSSIIRRLYARLTSTLDAILKRGRDAGVFRPGIDSIDLYISISGLGYFYLSNRFTLSKLFERDLQSAANLQRRKKHIIEMTLRFVCRNASHVSTNELA
jgi:TetR/AcrR family transcriptional regulator